VLHDLLSYHSSRSEQFDVEGSFVPVSQELFHRLIDIQDVTFADRNHFMVRLVRRSLFRSGSSSQSCSSE